MKKYLFWIGLAACVSLVACSQKKTAPVQESSSMEIEPGSEPTQTGAEPGGLCGPNVSNCPAGFFCMYRDESQCNVRQEQGRCTAAPQMCTKELRPVCGCDGFEYPTRCVAYSNGVSVRNEGSCPKGASAIQ